MELSAQRLRDLLDYDPETGIFAWKDSPRPGWKGKKAGTLTRDGYIQIKVDGKTYQAHRLAMFYITGEWPKDQIDHKDGDRAQNRRSNIRQADHSLNNENQRNAQKNNSCGMLGVSPAKRPIKKPWRATIKVHGRVKHLGYFPTPNEAHEAYLRAKRELHQGCTI